MSITIVRQTFDERVQMYLKTSKEKLAMMLSNQDKYRQYKNSVDEYASFTHQELAEIMAHRDIFNSPQSCEECRPTEPQVITMTSTSSDGTSSTSTYTIDPKYL